MAMKTAAKPVKKPNKPVKTKALGNAKSLDKVVNVNDISPV